MMQQNSIMFIWWNNVAVDETWLLRSNHDSNESPVLSKVDVIVTF